MDSRGIGIVLKPSYFRQAVLNLASVDEEQPEQFALEVEGEAAL